MAISILITLTSGADAGPFELRSDFDGYATAWESGISRASLITGYTSILVPSGSTIVRVQSTGVCTNYRDISISIPTTTTTTTSTTTSTTSTTTIAPQLITYILDVELSPNCRNSIKVTVTPSINVHVDITSDFFVNAYYDLSVPLGGGSVGVYANVSNDLILAGTSKTYNYGIDAYKTFTGSDIYTSSITLDVKDAFDDMFIDQHIFNRSHNGGVNC
jgi:hypothetical protein